jgi:hypothetical protein
VAVKLHDTHCVLPNSLGLMHDGQRAAKLGVYAQPQPSFAGRELHSRQKRWWTPDDLSCLLTTLLIPGLAWVLVIQKFSIVGMCSFCFSAKLSL